MVTYFKDASSYPNRAFQIWLILIGRATNRQTLTYSQLDELMQYGTAQLGQILDYIDVYCKVNNLPRLTILVVKKSKGKPGTGMGDYNDAEREIVFEFNWYALIPPTPAELESTYKGSK